MRNLGLLQILGFNHIFVIRGASKNRLICNPFVHFLRSFLVIFRERREVHMEIFFWVGIALRFLGEPGWPGAKLKIPNLSLKCQHQAFGDAGVSQFY